MAMRIERWRFRLPGWQIALATALAIVLCTAYLVWREAALPAAIEGQTLSWRFQTRGPIPAPANIAILAIDDATMAAEKRWPISRRMLADAVDRLREAGAGAVGLDLLLLENSDPEDDAALARALRRLPAVLPLAFTFERDGQFDADTVRLIRETGVPLVRRDHATAAPEVSATDALVPALAFRDSTTLGHVNVITDEDGVLRQIHLTIAAGGRRILAFPVELARRFLDLRQEQTVLLLGHGLKLGDLTVLTDEQMRMPLVYYGPPKTIATYSLNDVLDGRISANLLADRVVLIGATATGTGDTFVTPFSQSLPGVEALATMLGNLLEGRLLRRTTGVTYIDIAFIVAMGAAAFLLSHLPQPLTAMLAVTALFTALVFTVQWTFQSQLLWLNLTFPGAAILLNAAAVVVTRVMQERRQRTNLSRYHSPLIADLLARERPETAERQQSAAILFVDMAGFTTRSESVSPEESARFLREFHGHIERAVLAHGGVLDQFLGDGAMVIFGLQQPGPAASVSALACARQFVATTAAWSRRLAASGARPLTVRVGIHYGPVVISRLGGKAQMHFSAAGDTVNIAARLEGLTRSPESTITASDAVVAAVKACGRQELLAGFLQLPPQPIRGREGKLSVWTWHHVPIPAD